MVDLPGPGCKTLEDAFERLRRVAAVEAGAKSLRSQQSVLIAAVAEAVVAGIDDAEAPILALLERHAADLVLEYLRLLEGGKARAPDFVEAHARAAAERHFPLETLLHGYRVGMHRLLQTSASALAPARGRDAVEVVTALTGFLLEFVDLVSSHATGHYLERSRLLADVASDQRSELFSLLLGGYDPADSRATGILRDAGFADRRLRFCVVLAQSLDPLEMQNPARARRLLDYIDGLLAHLPGKRLLDIHRNRVAIVFSHQHRMSGWSAPEMPLAARVAREMLKVGPAARLGVSNEVESSAQIPAAYRQAAIAFDESSVGRRVVQFGDIRLQQLLLRFAGDDFSRVMPDWAHAFHAADSRNRGKLSATLRAYADNDMNLLETARRLGIHANTVYARFDRIEAVSGRDARRFDALNELLIVTASQA